MPTFPARMPLPTTAPIPLVRPSSAPPAATPAPALQSTGEALTLDALMARQKEAAARQGETMQQPVTNITQGLGQLGWTLVNALQERRANKGIAEGDAAVADAFKQMDPVTGQLPPEAMQVLMQRDPRGLGVEMYKTAMAARAAEGKQEQWTPIPTPEGETGQWYQNQNGDTKKVGGATGNKSDGTMELRKEYNSQGPVKDYPVISNAVERIKFGASTGDAPGDMALIFGYMKLLDPQSTVREGEYATVQNSGGVPDWIINSYNKAKDGQILNPDQRAKFVNQAYGQYNVWTKSLNSVNDRYGKIATATGVDPNLVLVNPVEFTPDAKPEDPDAVTPEETAADSPLPTMPEGFDPAKWPTADEWKLLSPEQRALFVRRSKKGVVKP